MSASNARRMKQKKAQALAALSLESSDPSSVRSNSVDDGIAANTVKIAGLLKDGDENSCFEALQLLSSATHRCLKVSIVVL